MHHHQMHITVQNKQKWIWAKAAKAERNIPIRNLMRLYRHSHVPRVLSITTKIFLHENCAYFNTWKLLRGEIECCWQLLYVQLNIVYCMNVSVCVCVRVCRIRRKLYILSRPKEHFANIRNILFVSFILHFSFIPIERCFVYAVVIVSVEIVTFYFYLI